MFLTNAVPRAVNSLLASEKSSLAQVTTINSGYNSFEKALVDKYHRDKRWYHALILGGNRLGPYMDLGIDSWSCPGPQKSKKQTKKIFRKKIFFKNFSIS